MIFIFSSKLEEVVQRDNEKFSLCQLINKKKYTKADTPLSYRQINTLGNDRLFPEDRDNKRGWRKFSLKELVYFYIVFELKKFGLPHEVLKELSDSFFKEPTPNIKGYETNKYTSEFAILCVLVGTEMMVTISNEGKVNYFDPSSYLLIGREETPTIQIRLNDVVNAVNKKGKKIFPIRWSGRNYLWKKGVNLSDNEKEVLDLIRNKDYSAVQVKKTDGKVSMAYAERLINAPQMSTEEIIKLIDKKDFADIDIVKRNGNIVGLKTNESIKLKS